MERVLIVGAGYVGRELGQRLRKKSPGSQITGWVSSAASALHLKELGWEVIAGNVVDPALWRKQSWDVVYYCAAASQGGLEAYETVYKQGLSLALKESWKQFIYTSSTSVYGQYEGEWVDETSLTQPTEPTALCLLEAEQRVQQAGGTVARLSGIYGPGRGYLFRKLMQGEALLDGTEERWINQIHRDDIVNALLFLAEKEETRGQVWNATDDEPVRVIDFYKWACQTFNRPMPPHAPSSVKPQRKNANKRISNRKLRAAGWNLIYPTFREGYLGDL